MRLVPDVPAEERVELVRLVERLMTAQGSEDEQAAWLRALELRTGCPHVVNLIFWPRHEGFETDLTAEQVVEEALAYRPFEL